MQKLPALVLFSFAYRIAPNGTRLAFPLIGFDKDYRSEEER